MVWEGAFGRRMECDQPFKVESLKKIRNSIFDVNENSEKRYMRGWINFIIRLYYFLQEGLNQVNQWKYIIMGILGFAFLIKITSYIVIGLMFAGAVPILMLIGYLWVTRGKKSTEYYQTRDTTIFGRYGVEIQERQIQLLEDIKTKLHA